MKRKEETSIGSAAAHPVATPSPILTTARALATLTAGGVWLAWILTPDVVTTPTAAAIAATSLGIGFLTSAAASYGGSQKSPIQADDRPTAPPQPDGGSTASDPPRRDETGAAAPAPPRREETAEDWARLSLRSRRRRRKVPDFRNKIGKMVQRVAVALEAHPHIDFSASLSVAVRVDESLEVAEVVGIDFHAHTRDITLRASDGDTVYLADLLESSMVEVADRVFRAVG